MCEAPAEWSKSMQELHDMAQAQALALAIVDTLPEPFLVLDDSLQLLAGSRCFYEVYGEDPSSAHGRSMFELSGGNGTSLACVSCLPTLSTIGRALTALSLSACSQRLAS